MAVLSKKSVHELTVFGGTRTFAKPVIFGEPNIPDVDGVLQDLREVLSSRILSNSGPRLRAFEESVADVVKVDHCVATDNATSALQIVARALGVSGEVIVPSFTFIATANAFAWQGIRPVFVDVDPKTHTIDSNSVKSAITPDTTAICAVHLWGNLCNVEELSKIANRHDLSLIYDSAHAFGCSDNAGVPVGNFGDAEVVSFHATKFVNAFEGGAVLTNDDALANRLRQLRNFGFDDNGYADSIGINAKMSEASAVMGLHSLRNLQRIMEVNRHNYERYCSNLRSCSGIEIVAPLEPELSNCQYVVASVDIEHVGISRNTLLTCLRAEGVMAKAYFVPPCHLQAAYINEEPKKLPVSEKLAKTIFCLPTGLAVEDEKIDRICDLIRLILKSGPDIELRLSGNIDIESNTQLVRQRANTLNEV